MPRSDSRDTLTGFFSETQSANNLSYKGPFSVKTFRVHVEGEHSGCSLGVVDIKTKVAF